MTHNFENLDVWKKGCDLAVDVCVTSHHSKQFALKDQIQRAAISIPSNIAEGAERGSPKEFIKFLGYSQGSCGELRTQLTIHQRVSECLQLEPFKNTEALIEDTKTVSRMIRGLITRVEKDATP